MDIGPQIHFNHFHVDHRLLVLVIDFPSRSHVASLSIELCLQGLRGGPLILDDV